MKIITTFQWILIFEQSGQSPTRTAIVAANWRGCDVALRPNLSYRIMEKPTLKSDRLLGGFEDFPRCCITHNSFSSVRNTYTIRSIRYTSPVRVGRTRRPAGRCTEARLDCRWSRSGCRRARSSSHDGHTLGSLPVPRPAFDSLAPTGEIGELRPADLGLAISPQGSDVMSREGTS